MELTRIFDKYKNKVLNINIALIILALIVANNIYKKQNQDINSFKAKNKTETQKNKVLQDLSGIQKRIASYKKLLVKKDASEIINTISKIAVDEGIEMISVRPMVEEAYGEYIKIPFNLQLKTQDFHALGKFVSRMESYRDVYVIDSIAVKSEANRRDLSIGLKISLIANSL